MAGHTVFIWCVERNLATARDRHYARICCMAPLASVVAIPRGRSGQLNAVMVMYDSQTRPSAPSVFPRHSVPETLDGATSHAHNPEAKIPRGRQSSLV